MVKRKRRKCKDTMSGVVVSGFTGLSVTSAIPVSLTPGSAGLRTGYAQGIGKVGTTLPTIGKLKGTSMVLKATKKLIPKRRRRRK